jgi:hypothetical protein
VEVIGDEMKDTDTRDHTACIREAGKAYNKNDARRPSL